MAICPLCASTESSYRFSERSYDLRSCDNCSLLFIDPYPDRGPEVHAQVRENTYDTLEVLDAATHRESEALFYGSRIPVIMRDLDGASSILDVGCGTGYLLGMLADTPIQRRVGIELNRARAAYARRSAKCDVFELPVEEFETDEKFDVILLMNVLSHVPSFDTLFGRLRHLLAPDGKLIIKTGEVAQDVRKEDVPDWGVPGHVHFLGFDTVLHICTRYGFSILGEPERISLSQELFSPEVLLAPGRSRLRNVAKRVVAGVPGLRHLFRLGYELRHGKRVRSVYLVLTPT